MSIPFQIQRFDEALHLSLVEPLTSLLHSAYAPLAEQGMRYTATYQPPEKTLQRLKSGESYLCFYENELCGTVTLYPENESSSCEYYRKPGVYCFGQFAIRSDLQGKQLGSMLMDYLEYRARELGARELALDTAEPAHHLIQMYEKRGYQIVDHTQWEVTNYRSVIMSKSLQ